MLICGTNLPIILTFDEEANTLQDLSVIIYPRGATSEQAIKSWRLQNCFIDGKDVICPINQSDLMADKLGITEDLNIGIEIKWLGENDTVYNNIIVWDYISYRKDTSVLS